MRLLTRTTLYFLLAMVPLLFATGYFLFKQFSNQINEQADKELVYEEVQWIQYLEATTTGNSNFILRSPDLLIYPTEKEPATYPTIATITGTKARENVQIPYRQLTHVVSINGIPYQIVIRKSQEQKIALVANITLIMLVVFAGLFLATLLFNWFISKRIWKPFKDSLNKVRNLELQKIDAIRFEETNTREFNELNRSLNTMVQKIRGDYVNMKEFTENAAHEMQTPLAVAQSKLELLLQDETLNNAQVSSIAQATTALSRLSKLNQSLLLLAKIENDQYRATEELDLSEIVLKYLRLFEEMITVKEISVETKFEGVFKVFLHPFLADSLVSNLLGNAIKYNQQQGTIVIGINDKDFCISNTSALAEIDTKHLFQRFQTSAKQNDQSTGLGLAIVKKIADNAHLTIRYQNQEGVHSFCLQKF